MNLYLISQTEIDGYDTFDSAVVVAESEEHARDMIPVPLSKVGDFDYGCWCSSREKVNVQYLGKAADDLKTVIVCFSFNAG